MEPVFLLSLPRSGSTLLQRMMASHPEIATTSEPWILLPLIYAFREEGVVAEYEHHNLAQAMNDLCDQLPNGKEDCFLEMKEMVSNIYEKLGGGTAYFLDKTPRYHLIVDEIRQLYPDSKIIILWRNPLAVAASMIETWGKGKWNLYWFSVDLYKGLANLVKFYAENNENVLAIQFEEYVKNPDIYNNKLFEYLGLTNQEKISDKFTDINLNGRMGDPTGVKEYSSVSDESLNKWRKTMSGPIRKIWCRRYINWIGEERLKVMGYRKSEILDQLDSDPASIHTFLSDIIRICYSPIDKYIKKKLFRY